MPKLTAVRFPRTAAAIVLALGLVHCSGQQPPAAPKDPSQHDVLVEVRSVLLDPSSNSPIVVLEEVGGHRRLPIWIGEAEARSIAVELGGVEWPRPNSHDLAKRLLAGLEASVERVVIRDLRAGTYFAVLVVRAVGKRVEIDARPSDAIAVALRVDAPVYVRAALLVEPGEGHGPSDAEEKRVAL